VEWLKDQSSESADLLKQTGMLLYSGHPEKYAQLLTTYNRSDQECIDFIKLAAWLPI
jgi:hypothetical protein